MVSALFQSEVSALESQVAALQAQIAAARSRIAALGECEAQAGSAIQRLQEAVVKITGLAPDAIATLKASVLNLFNVSDGDQGEQSVPDGSLSDPLLNSESCAIDPDAYWTEAQPNGSSWELATPIACLVEDAPLRGQYYELTCSRISNVEPIYEDSEAKPAIVEAVTIEKVAKEENLFDLIRVSDSVSYMRRTDTGEIACVYVGFNNKGTAKRWAEWLANTHTLASGFEIRAAKRLSGFKYEVKFWSMSLKSIERLATCDLSKFPTGSYGDATKRKPEVVAAAPKSFQVDPEVMAVMETEAKLESAAVEEAIASIQPPALPTPTYNPNPFGRRGAAANWKALQAAGGLNLQAVGTGINNGAAVIEKKETEVSPEPQAFNIGDSVAIKSARHGEDLLGLTGVIKIANPVGCVVEVSGQTRWFCCDEIEILTEDFDVEF